jgi:hypothetical protein
MAKILFCSNIPSELLPSVHKNEFCPDNVEPDHIATELYPFVVLLFHIAIARLFVTLFHSHHTIDE